MTLEEMLARIEAIEVITDPLMEELGALEMEIRKLKAAEWIAANGVTKDNVQLTMGGSPGVPFFEELKQAKEWVATQTVSHPFVEWNGQIFSRENFMQSRMVWNSTANFADVQ